MKKPITCGFLKSSNPNKRPLGKKEKISDPKLIKTSAPNKPFPLEFNEENRIPFLEIEDFEIGKACKMFFRSSLPDFASRIVVQVKINDPKGVENASAVDL